MYILRISYQKLSFIQYEGFKMLIMITVIDSISTIITSMIAVKSVTKRLPVCCLVVKQSRKRGLVLNSQARQYTALLCSKGSLKRK